MQFLGVFCVFLSTDPARHRSGPPPLFSSWLYCIRVGFVYPSRFLRIQVGRQYISTRRAHHEVQHLASDDALARTHTTEQAAGVDAAAEAAATGGLIMPGPGGAGAAPGQVLPPSPLPGDGDSNESFERTAADRGVGAVWDGAGPARLPLGAGGGLARSVGLSLPCSVRLDSLLETTNNYYYFYEMMM